jgi:hypothetical protein
MPSKSDARYTEQVLIQARGSHMCRRHDLELRGNARRISLLHDALDVGREAKKRRYVDVGELRGARNEIRILGFRV